MVRVSELNSNQVLMRAHLCCGLSGVSFTFTLIHVHTQTHRCSTIVRVISTISVPPQSPITIGCLAITAPALQQAKWWMGGDVIRMLSCSRLMAGSLQSTGHGLQGLRRKAAWLKTIQVCVQKTLLVFSLKRWLERTFFLNQFIKVSILLTD